MVVPAMRAVDPTIKFVAMELSDNQGQTQLYLPPFVRGVAAQVDAVATHYYCSCNEQDADPTVRTRLLSSRATRDPSIPSYAPTEP
jgi:hypothetical protein